MNLIIVHMAFKNYRTLIRVECTPIIAPDGIVKQLREIAGFPEMLGDYTYFKIGDTTNYKNGGVSNMSSDDVVYRYVKESNGLEVRLDFTSQFYYINLSGENIPGDFSPYIRIIEEVTKTIMNIDAYVKVTNYAIRKDYEEIKNPPSETEIDNARREVYKYDAEQVHILFTSREIKDRFNKTLIAIKGEEKLRPRYEHDERLFDTAFLGALKKAEEKYGLV